MREDFQGGTGVLKRLVAGICTAALVCLLLPAAPAQAEPSSGGVTVEQAAKRLVDLNTQLEMASEDLVQIDADIEATKDKIADIEKQRAKTEDELSQARKTLSATVEEMYENGNVTYLEVLLGAMSFDDFVSKLDLLERVSSSRASAIENVTRLQDELDAQQEELSKTLSAQESLKDQAESKQTTIQTSINSAENLYESLTPSMREAVNDETDKIAGSSSTSQGGSSAGDASASKPAGSGSGSSASKPSKPSGSGSSSGSSSGSGSSSDKPSKPAGSGSSGGSTSTAGAHPQVVKIAKKYLGVKYVWGGASPKTGFDCSGLTMYCYQQIGISLSHSSRWQYEEGKHIARSALQPGDLVFFGPSVSGIHHVGIYIGGGQYIHAPQTGDVVKISSLSSRGDYVGACRP